jgi:RHS repeat-associated protein
MYVVLLLTCSAVLNGAWLWEGYPFYDPFGARADPRNPVRPWTPTATASKRGFTGHEHAEDLGLIHMRGRVYDPRTGRFLSRDPVVQFPHSTQSYNRYTYALNNPLSWVDPSGFSVERHLALRSDLPTISITQCWGACTPAEPPSSGDQGHPGDKPHSTSTPPGATGAKRPSPWSAPCLPWEMPSGDTTIHLQGCQIRLATRSKERHSESVLD